ncbi:MAG: NADH-quinone oxidoreductase subunit J [Thermodesulfovibrionales bacterium]
MTLPQLFFGYFFVMILGLALVVVTRRNLVHAVLWMLLMFVHIGGLYLFLNAEFFAIIQIIVYAGAILVMFLFVVLLLKINVREQRFVSSWHFRAMAVSLILLLCVTTLGRFVMGPTGDFSIERIHQQTHIRLIGATLFNDYVLPFLVIGLILFIPMIAVTVLAIRRARDGAS